MNLLEKVIKILKEYHKGELNFNEDLYYIFLKDVAIMIYVEDEELKVKFQTFNEGKMFYYNVPLSFEDLLEGESIQNIKE